MFGQFDFSQIALKTSRMVKVCRLFNDCKHLHVGTNYSVGADPFQVPLPEAVDRSLPLSAPDICFIMIIGTNESY